MSTQMTDRERALAASIFEGVLALQRPKSDNIKFLKALQFFCGSQHLVAGDAVRIRSLELAVATRRSAQPRRRLRGFLRYPGQPVPDSAPGADVRFHGGSSACLSRRRKRGQDG